MSRIFIFERRRRRADGGDGRLFHLFLLLDVHLHLDGRACT
jgi:hypothetical protein